MAKAIFWPPNQKGLALAPRNLISQPQHVNHKGWGEKETRRRTDPSTGHQLNDSTQFYGYTSGDKEQPLVTPCWFRHIFFDRL